MVVLTLSKQGFVSTDARTSLHANKITFSESFKSDTSFCSLNYPQYVFYPLSVLLFRFL